MHDFSKKQLMVNYLLGICTSNERKEVEKWLSADVYNIRTLQRIAKELNQEHPLSSTDKDQIKKNILANATIGSNYKNRKTSASTNLKYFKDKRRASITKKAFFKSASFWIRVAAAILVIVTAVAGAYYYVNKNLVEPEIVWQQRTLPYGQTATLHFSDGSVIKLKGGSTLRYPKKFAVNKREVFLEGEAFFSVAPDKSHPFIVHAGNITTRVLGTSFNIEAYEEDKNAQVVVTEGKVAVVQNKPETSFNQAKNKIILERNQWVTYRKAGGLVEKGQGDIREMIAWKDQVLIFNDKPLDVVARMLERWYGVRIILKDEKLKNIVLSGRHVDVSLKMVLESIQYVLGIEYDMDGDVVTIQLPEKNNQNIDNKI